MDINSWAAIATIISTVIALVTLGFLLMDRRQATNQARQQGQAGLYLPQNIQQQRRRSRRRKTLFTVISLSLIVFIASIGVLSVRLFLPSKNPALTPTSANSIPTLPPTYWRSILTQVAPDCNNPQGVVWYVHAGSTYYSCKASALLMREVGTSYAEIDLDKVNGGNYNQTNFRVKVQVTFQNTADTSTLAALIVQTPAPRNQVGGYIFTLSPDGNWQLQYVEGATTIPTVQRGLVNIGTNQPVTMEVIVQNGVLEGFLNGQLAVSYRDTLDSSPRQVGLMIEHTSAPTFSPVQFSNFELDSAS